MHFATLAAIQRFPAFCCVWMWTVCCEEQVVEEHTTKEKKKAYQAAKEVRILALLSSWKM